MNFFSFKKNSLNTGNVARCCFDFWNKHYRSVFFVFSFAILSLGMYFWYQSLYRSDWSNEEKNQYKKTQNKEVELREQEFKKVIEEIERKRNSFGVAPRLVKNIFESYSNGQETVSQPVNANTSMP